MKRASILSVGLISGVALLALGACGKKTETAATGTAAPANATASASAPSLVNPPHRKIGLWTSNITSGEKVKQTVKECLDATTEEKMKWWGSNAGGAKRDCEQESITPHLGGGWDFHSVCKMGESGTVTSDGSARGDFSTNYTVEVSSTTSGSPIPQANGAHKTMIEARYEGPCPADMKPGDMEVGGFKINLTTGPDGKPGMTLPNGGHLSSGDIARMRAQAKAMEAQMKDQH